MLLCIKHKQFEKLKKKKEKKRKTMLQPRNKINIICYHFLSFEEFSTTKFITTPLPFGNQE